LASSPDLPPQPSLPPQLFWPTSDGVLAEPAAGTITPAPAIIPAIAALTRSFFIFEFMLSPFEWFEFWLIDSIQND
jgi:hypothetical protein